MDARKNYQLLHTRDVQYFLRMTNMGDQGWQIKGRMHFPVALCLRIQAGGVLLLSEVSDRGNSQKFSTGPSKTHRAPISGALNRERERICCSQLVTVAGTNTLQSRGVSETEKTYRFVTGKPIEQKSSLNFS